jgi:ComF family protein
MPKKLKASGALVLRKLFFYDKENPSLPEIKLIYLMKKKKHTRLTEFSAEQIIPIINEELDGLVTDMEQVTVTGVPRGERARRAYGFDHAELLARSVAKKLGIKYERLLCSRLSSKIQKKLDAGSREKNANISIRLRKNVSLDGKYVILIDDMVTTGASMAACVSKLMSAGAVGVACFSMASKNKM